MPLSAGQLFREKSRRDNRSERLCSCVQLPKSSSLLSSCIEKNESNAANLLCNASPAHRESTSTCATPHPLAPIIIIRCRERKKSHSLHVCFETKGAKEFLLHAVDLPVIASVLGQVLLCTKELMGCEPQAALLISPSALSPTEVALPKKVFISVYSGRK